VLFVKLSCTSDELDDLEGLDDAALAKVVRDALKGFRSGRDSRAGKDIDLIDATTSGVSGGPREGEKVTQDSALRRHEQHVLQSERDREVAAIIPHYGRLP
jgi:hypothetical protein